jgi:hypothetical protein
MAKRKPKYIRNIEFEVSISEQALKSGGIAKSILIIVEGDTEKNYFEGLKNNDLLKNQLAGIDVQIKNSLVEMLWFAMQEHTKFEKVWLVFDNDKRNAFILDKNTFDRLNHKIPISIFQKIKTAYNQDFHNYFLSRYDYLQWLKSVLGAEDTLEYWDTIQNETKKAKDFEKFEYKNPYNLFLESELFKSKKTEIYTKINSRKGAEFDTNWKNYVEKGYSCIAFEFWLLLHFEQNKNAFLWVEKEKLEAIDVFTYYRNKWRSDYIKGNEFIKNKHVQCVAYNSLLDDYKKYSTEITLKDQYAILLKVITAYRNTLWLKKEMQPILERQNYKWYEVNPYVDGLEKLVSELLNIHHCKQEIAYFELNLVFNFENNTLSLDIENNSSTSIILNSTAKDSFIIRNTQNKTFKPQNIETIQIGLKEEKKIKIAFNIPKEENQNLILHFKDFRLRAKSSELIILLD